MCYDSYMTIIKCKKCNLEKPDTEYRIWRGRRNVWCDQCRERNNEWYDQDKDGRKTKARTYYQRIKHKVAGYRSDLRIKRKYDLTRDEWNGMFAKQGGLCGICKMKMTKPCVDHDHETGKVRGLLHRECNLKLIAIEDSKFLSQAQSYLDSMK